jgi:hypothetical protein
VSDLLTTAARGDAAFTTAGALHVVFHDETLDVGSGPLRLFHDRDADGPYGTAGFGTDAPVAVLALGARESVTPQPDRGVGPGTQVATVRAGPFAGRVVVLYADETADGSGDLDVFARVSDDQGTTWSVATRVNDDGGSSAQILPALASDSDSGDLAACWLDPRSDGSGRAVRAHAAVSTDGGATWSANLALTGSPSDEDDLDADREYGDRLGLAGHGGCWFAAWADASDATQDNPGGQATTAAYVARFQRR